MRWVIIAGVAIAVMAYVSYQEGWLQPDWSQFTEQERQRLVFLKYAVNNPVTEAAPKSP